MTTKFNHKNYFLPFHFVQYVQLSWSLVFHDVDHNRQHTNNKLTLAHDQISASSCCCTKNSNSRNFYKLNSCQPWSFLLEHSNLLCFLPFAFLLQTASTIALSKWTFSRASNIASLQILMVMFTWMVAYNDENSPDAFWKDVILKLWPNFGTSVVLNHWLFK